MSPTRSSTTLPSTRFGKSLLHPPYILGCLDSAVAQVVLAVRFNLQLFLKSVVRTSILDD